MPYAQIARRLACALSMSLFATTAFAGGYGGGSTACSPIAPQEAKAMLAYSDDYRDGDFRVRQDETAGAEAFIGPNGETGFGYGISNTSIYAPQGAISWKRTVQRSSGYATNGAASAAGFSATFVKVRTNDGKYYIYKGMANTGASVGPNGQTTTSQGIAKSTGGRY